VALVGVDNNEVCWLP